MSQINSIQESDEVLGDAISSARSKIDNSFGNEYADKHPELVGQCVMAFAILRTGIRLNEWIDNFSKAISESISELKQDAG